MTDDSMRHTLVVTPTARRQLAPESVAFAADEFIDRVIYRIDDLERTVTVLDIAHRRDAYRVNR